MAHNTHIAYGGVHNMHYTQPSSSVTYEHLCILKSKVRLWNCTTESQVDLMPLASYYSWCIKSYDLDSLSPYNPETFVNFAA